jgi:hypothetical protein
MGLGQPLLSFTSSITLRSSFTTATAQVHPHGAATGHLVSTPAAGAVDLPGKHGMARVASEWADSMMRQQRHPCDHPCCQQAPQGT